MFPEAPQAAYRRAARRAARPLVQPCRRRSQTRSDQAPDRRFAARAAPHNPCSRTHRCFSNSESRQRAGCRPPRAKRGSDFPRCSDGCRRRAAHPRERSYRGTSRRALRLPARRCPRREDRSRPPFGRSAARRRRCTSRKTIRRQPRARARAPRCPTICGFWKISSLTDPTDGAYRG